MSNERKFGITVYGATGFTGRLVCEYLNNQYGVNQEITWAMAGRSKEKLESVRDEMGIPKDVPLLVVDANNAASVTAMVEQSNVVLTTVGPYQLYGSDLVEACIQAGTDYVDLCGEPAWMNEMITKHQSAAKAGKGRIVFSCGFDSEPSDLGIFFLQQAIQEKYGKPATRIKGRVRAIKGTASGGTVASFKETMIAAAKNPALYKVLGDPFSLTEDFAGPAQPSGLKPVYDDDLGSWSAPFVMATINTKNVHRSNFLLGHPYGENFVYDEMLLTGPGEKGEQIAKAVAADRSMANDKQQPGEGPSLKERNEGHYDILFAGTTDSGESLFASVQGDKDPGYGSTSKMIAESAVCLLKNPELASGGIWTSASVMGGPLIDRLQANAGLTFKIEKA